MKIIKFFCDKCGKEVENVTDMAEVSVNIKWNVDKTYSTEKMLCENCFINIKKSLNSWDGRTKDAGVTND